MYRALLGLLNNRMRVEVKLLMTVMTVTTRADPAWRERYGLKQSPMAATQMTPKTGAIAEAVDEVVADPFRTMIPKERMIDTQVEG